MLEPFISAAWCFSFKFGYFNPQQSLIFILKKNRQLVKRNPIKGTVSQATLSPISLVPPGVGSFGFWQN
jgi:hypothetical protein